MTIYQNPPNNIDIYANITSETCPRVWFSDANGVVLDRVLDCEYGTLATDTDITLTYHAPTTGNYKLTLVNKAYSALTPSWSPSCSTTVTGTTKVPSVGLAQVADYNIMICDGTSGSVVAWIDPKWTVKKPDSGNGYTVQTMSELVRNDNSTTTIAVNQAVNNMASVFLSVPGEDALGNGVNGPFVGNTLVFRPGVPLSTTYTAIVALADPDNFDFQWSTDGRTWNTGNITESVGVGELKEITVQLRYTQNPSEVFSSFLWVLNNSIPSSLSCGCSPT